MYISTFIEIKGDAEKKASNRSRRLEKPKTFFGDSTSTGQEDIPSNVDKPNRKRILRVYKVGTNHQKSFLNEYVDFYTAFLNETFLIC